MYNSLAIRDLFMLLGLLFFPMLAEYFSWFKMADEIIFLVMIGIIFYRIIKLRYQFTTFDILLIVYLLYSFFLVIYHDLPSSSIIQIFISSKFIIIYIYFNAMSNQYKAYFFGLLTKILVIIFFISLLISVLQFAMPDVMYGYSNDGRGIMGITPKGLFMSRTLYPEFLIMFIVIIFSIKNTPAWFVKSKNYIYLSTAILVFLTFARKELALLLFFTPVMYHNMIKQSSKPVIYSGFIILLVLAIVGFLVLFADMNASTFTDKQVRYHIFQSAMDIFNYYFPFGSGPGTYGSIMSMQYKDIYEQFSVSTQIVGTDGHRGVIFDLFLVSLLAEYGMGWFFFIFFIVTMSWNRDNPYLKGQLDFFKLRLLLFIFLLSVAIFVPILLNWVGFVTLTVLALISDKNKYAYNSKVKEEEHVV